MAGFQTKTNRLWHSLKDFQDSVQPYYEAGVGIENIFKLFRVDAMWRFSYLDHRQCESIWNKGYYAVCVLMPYYWMIYCISSKTGVPVHEFGKVMLRKVEMVGAISVISTWPWLYFPCLLSSHTRSAEYVNHRNRMTCLL